MSTKKEREISKVQGKEKEREGGEGEMRSKGSAQLMRSFLVGLWREHADRRQREQGSPVPGEFIQAFQATSATIRRDTRPPERSPIPATMYSVPVSKGWVKDGERERERREREREKQS